MASEKVELARRIEEALAGRVGRTPKGKAVEEKIPQNFAELPQGESRDIAAKAVGMNRETYWNNRNKWNKPYGTQPRLRHSHGEIPKRREKGIGGKVSVP